jgi:hypothetical protein
LDFALFSVVGEFGHQPSLLGRRESGKRRD